MAMNLQPNPSPEKNTVPTGSVFFYEPDGKPPRVLSPAPSSISHSVTKKSTTTKIIFPNTKNLPPPKNLPRHQKSMNPSNILLLHGVARRK